MLSAGPSRLQPKRHLPSFWNRLEVHRAPSIVRSPQHSSSNPRRSERANPEEIPKESPRENQERSPRSERFQAKPRDPPKKPPTDSSLSTRRIKHRKSQKTSLSLEESANRGSTTGIPAAGSRDGLLNRSYRVPSVREPSRSSI